MNDYTKAERKLMAIIRKAKEYRDKNGYRENLGYDSEPEFREFLGTLNLSYQEQSNLIAAFYRGCDSI